MYVGKKLHKLIAASVAVGSLFFVPPIFNTDFMPTVQAENRRSTTTPESEIIRRSTNHESALETVKPQPATTPESETKLSAKSCFEKGLNLYKQEKYQDAITYFNFAVKLNPNMVEVYACRGDAFLELGKYTEAIDDYNQAIRFDSTNAVTYYKKNAVAYYKLGIVHANNRSYDSAKDNFNKALEFDPTYADAYFRRGYIYGEILKNYHVAIVNYYGAIYFSPNKPEYYYYRGKSYQALGETANANSDFAKAKQLGYQE